MTAAGMTRSWRCPPETILVILEKVRGAGATVEGSPSEGSIAAPTPLGRVEGRYAYDGDLLTVTLTACPPLLPARVIWGRLDGILGDPVMMA